MDRAGFLTIAAHVARAIRMRVCKRCGGSGFLHRPSRGAASRFARCTNCGGTGTKPAPYRAKQERGAA